VTRASDLFGKLALGSLLLLFGFHLFGQGHGIWIQAAPSVRRH
jgi:hypothetical protein